MQFDNLIDCMRSNGYDNAHCTREQIAYSECAKAAEIKFEQDSKLKDNAPRDPLPAAVDKLRPPFDPETWSVQRTMVRNYYFGLFSTLKVKICF